MHRLKPGRRLNDDALVGAQNMARDAALLEAREEPTLRFYRWLRPTISLGYFQAAEQLPLLELKARGFDVVRRATGGKAILHQHELTYSLCVPESGMLAGGPAAAMGAVHDVLAAELQRQASVPIHTRRSDKLLSDTQGSAWCFEDSSPLDLVMAGRKLLGSAARRRHGWVLFHGSLVIQRPDANPEIAELGFEPDQDGITAALSSALGYRFEDGAWSPAELKFADAIEQSKFASESFTLNR